MLHFCFAVLGSRQWLGSFPICARAFWQAASDTHFTSHHNTWYCRKLPSLATTEHFIPSVECAKLLKTHANCWYWWVCDKSILPTSVTYLNNQSGDPTKQSTCCYAPIIGLQLKPFQSQWYLQSFGFNICFINAVTETPKADALFCIQSSRIHISDSRPSVLTRIFCFPQFHREMMAWQIKVAHSHCSQFINHPLNWCYIRGLSTK
jgi:hypothetical protein